MRRVWCLLFGHRAGFATALRGVNYVCDRCDRWVGFDGVR